ncbi:Hpt domain-containing protein [Chiayiivirga flava]|uniref:HPt (Histidine-containing phosphotransfer) domain-containing protein n=1 Tax=Chiayiivirga flava TaxID=659595 RepID=A0A7W8G3C7_9GAMM|nr:Hpt domain-containing protein [Chiayiivirga flava]MBB5209705.1 HPt (histidine-containing phosphotransfer) domain-containing protein [Chiayiivirga flava]
MESLEQLHLSYRRSLEDKRRQLRVSWDVLCGEDVSDMQVRDMHRRLHQLCGSAGAYGFQEICDIARAMERRWVQWLAQAPSDRLPTYLLCAELAGSMMRLLDLLQDAARET